MGIFITMTHRYFFQLTDGIVNEDREDSNASNVCIVHRGM